MLTRYDVFIETVDGELITFPSFAKSPKQALLRAKRSPQWSEFRDEISRSGIIRTISGTGAYNDPFISEFHYS